MPIQPKFRNAKDMTGFFAIEVFEGDYIGPGVQRVVEGVCVSLHKPDGTEIDTSGKMAYKLTNGMNFVEVGFKVSEE
jgi:hypothetical protein